MYSPSTLLAIDYLTDTRMDILAAALLAGLILIMIVAAKLSGGNRGTAKKKRHGSLFGFGRKARRAGLNRVQIRALRSVIKRYGITDPVRLLTSEAYLDRVLSQSLRDLNHAALEEGERERRKYVLLSTKRSLSTVRSTGPRKLSTKQLQNGTELTLITDDNERFCARVVSSSQSMLGLRAMDDSYHHSFPEWAKGTPLKVTFHGREPGSLYGFRTTVLGTRRKTGTTILYLVHSDDVRHIQKRRSPRRVMDKPAYFYPVTVMQSGGKGGGARAVVARDRRHLGHLEDISAGGCALRAKVPLRTGSLIRVDFEFSPNNQVSAYGKVRSVERQGIYSLMHIMFTRVSRRHLNQILAFVYDLEGDSEEW